MSYRWLFPADCLPFQSIPRLQDHGAFDDLERVLLLLFFKLKKVTCLTFRVGCWKVWRRRLLCQILRLRTFPCFFGHIKQPNGILHGFKSGGGLTQLRSFTTLVMVISSSVKTTMKKSDLAALASLLQNKAYVAYVYYIYTYIHTSIYIEAAVRVSLFHPQTKTNSEDELRRRIPRGRIPTRRRMPKTNSPKTNCPPKMNSEDEFPEDELRSEDEFPKTNCGPKTNSPPKRNSEDEFCSL